MPRLKPEQRGSVRPIRTSPTQADNQFRSEAESVMGMLEHLGGRGQNQSTSLMGHLDNLTRQVGTYDPPPVQRATGWQGQDLGFRGYQPRFSAGLDPSAYGPNRPPFIPQALQDPNIYRPDESQGFRDYEGWGAGVFTALGMNPGNPAPGSWEYRGDPAQGFRGYEGPGAGFATEMGWNPGKAARGSWEYDANAKAAPTAKAQTPSPDRLNYLQLLDKRRRRR